MILFIDRCAFNLQEKALGIDFEKVDRLLRHLCERRVRCVSGRVLLADDGRIVEITVIACLRSRQTHRHIAVAEKPQERRLLIRRLHGCQPFRIRHDPVARRRGRGKQRLILKFAGLAGFKEGLHTAPQRHVGAGTNELFGDGPHAAVFSRIFGALRRRRFRAVALAGRHVRKDRRGRGILNFSRGNVPRRLTRLLREFKKTRLRLAVNVDADRAVVTLHAGIPSGGGRRRIRHVIRFLRLGIQRIVRVLPRHGQRINPGEGTRRTAGKIAGGGDFRIPHPVADQQNHILCRTLFDGIAQQLRLIVLQTTSTAPLRNVTRRRTLRKRRLTGAEPRLRCGKKRCHRGSTKKGTDVGNQSHDQKSFHKN